MLGAEPVSGEEEDRSRGWGTVYVCGSDESGLGGQQERDPAGLVEPVLAGD